MKNKSFLRAIIVGICDSCERMNNFLFADQNPKSQTPSFPKVYIQRFLQVVMRTTTISLHPRLGLSILLPHQKTSLVEKEKKTSLMDYGTKL